MEKILDKCSSGVSWLIYIVFYCLTLVIVFAPVYMIGLPGVLHHILLIGSFLVMILFPLVFPILQLILWIASIPFALGTPFGVYLIFYLICAALYLFLDLLPTVIRFISLSSKGRGRL